MKSASAALPVVHSRAADFVSLTKPRLNFLVVATSAAGYYLGASSPIDGLGFFNTVVGTALVAGGSSVFNQIYERDVDALMTRTRLRPLPDGRVAPREAAVLGVVLSLAGLLLLALGSTLLAAAVALATLVSYVAVYTPLKRRTSLATVIGAVPGALPPVIGWAGATGVLSREAWLLFAIVFLWQMPHFLAIAWMFREDYAPGHGLRRGARPGEPGADRNRDGQLGLLRRRPRARTCVPDARRQVRAAAHGRERPLAVLRVHHVPAARLDPDDRHARVIGVIECLAAPHQK
jgi:heme O synthase-like polyprenyltransferase